MVRGIRENDGTNVEVVDETGRPGRAWLASGRGRRSAAACWKATRAGVNPAGSSARGVSSACRATATKYGDRSTAVTWLAAGNAESSARVLRPEEHPTSGPCSNRCLFQAQHQVFCQ